jgi:hypothetical protein
MPKVRFIALLALCAAVAACDRSEPTRDIVGPRTGVVTFDADMADAGLAPIFDETAYAADDVSQQQVATGGKASGRFELVSPALGIAEERYSFTAQTTTFPLAKGQMEVQALQANNVTFKVHSEVTCMSIVGNQAYIGGRARKVWINNQEVPGLEGITTIWRVQDNGEGANAPPDLASLVFFFANEQAHCALRFQLPMTPTANGNIQVRAE